MLPNMARTRICGREDIALHAAAYCCVARFAVPCVGMTCFFSIPIRLRACLMLRSAIAYTVNQRIAMRAVAFPTLPFTLPLPLWVAASRRCVLFVFC